MVAFPSEDWVDHTTNAICEEMLSDLRAVANREYYADIAGVPIEKFEKLGKSGALRSMVRGYVVEFVHQTQEEIGDVNTIASLKDDPEQNDVPWDKYHKDTISGIIHTKGVIKKAVSEDFTKEEVIALCRAIIVYTVACFGHLPGYDTSAYSSGLTYSSIAKDMDAFKKYLDECLAKKSGISDARQP